MDTALLTLLVCPICKGKLTYKPKQTELLCKVDGLAYPIRDDIPVMLPEEARHFSQEDN